MSKQDSSSLQLIRPTSSDSVLWRNYWEQVGLPWRSEPEISEKRQEELTQNLSISADVERGIYPFKDVQLSRADIEWLLDNHATKIKQDNRTSSVQHMYDEHYFNISKGLDLRGANLRGANLRDLPLIRVQCGLDWDEWPETTLEQRDIAATHLEGADLSQTHLEGANLCMAHLEKARLYRAHLEEADLQGAHMQECNLVFSYLSGIDFYYTHLEGANLHGSHLEGLTISEKHLNYIHQWDEFFPASLPPASLYGVFFDSSTLLENIVLFNKKFGSVFLGSVHWGGVDLTLIEWSKVKKLGEEYRAKESRSPSGGRKDNSKRLKEYRNAVRANRQVAVALQNQGLNEEAAHFAYCAQKLQRTVQLRQKKMGQYFFSLFLDILAGYGYRPMRSVSWYLIITIGFAAMYAVFGHLPPVPDALVYSLTSFHGRGFFPGLGKDTTLHNPLIVLASVEAVVGLFIEISFIATFTQRYFGK